MSSFKIKFQVTEEMLVAAMRAFEPLSSVLRYREKDKWHTCDLMAMRDAIRAVAPLIVESVVATVEREMKEERHARG